MIGARPPNRGVSFSFVNGRSLGRRVTLRVVGARIVGVNGDPQPDDIHIDLDGDRIYPGLINAHDHLQLNSLPVLDDSKRYSDVREWIDDINERRRTDAAFEAQVAIEREERLFIGGVKNLLSGATTVAHHDPLYDALRDPAFPTQVMDQFGWSHSLYVDGDDRVRRSYAATPRRWPWIIHAAEGTGAASAHEFDKLDALGCLGSNTLIVHGVALSSRQRSRLLERGASLIWCPSSNLRLFGKTAAARDFIRRGRAALGTDSRLSGARDLLDEMRIAAGLEDLDEAALLPLVTADSARLLRLPDCGALRPGARADVLILPRHVPLNAASRADIRLVLRNGIARYGDAHYADLLAPAAHWIPVKVDGAAKFLDRHIAARLAASSLSEPGIDLSAIKRQAA
jgi:cytosine/adenosine deaminase-related metal-dependent hydrolase